MPTPTTEEWLRGLTMAEVTALIILGLEEIERRGVQTSGAVWTGQQWAVVTKSLVEPGCTCTVSGSWGCTVHHV